MTNYEQWLAAQGPAFQQGYDDAACGVPRYPEALAEWLRGYDAYCEYMTRSETARAA